MRSIANIKIVCPADAHSLEWALRQTVDLPGPIYFRLGRGREPDVYQLEDKWEFGKISLLRDGKDALIFANGIMVGAACQAAELLAKDGIDMTVADIHTLNPLDTNGLLSLVKHQSTVFVAEEHNTHGGVASIIADTMIDAGVSNIRLVRIGLPPNEFAIIGPPYYLYQHYGLDGAGLARRIRQELR